MGMGVGVSAASISSLAPIRENITQAVKSMDESHHLWEVEVSVGDPVARTQHSEDVILERTSFYTLTLHVEDREKDWE